MTPLPVVMLLALVASGPPAHVYSFSGPGAAGPEIPAPPAELHAAAYNDAVAWAKAGGNPYTARYLSLAAFPPRDPRRPGPGDRESAWLTLLRVLGKTKWKQQDYTPTRFYSGLLVRLDTAALGWDRGSRKYRIETLRQLGVDVSTFEEDFWEVLSRQDPYWFTSTSHGGHLYRGWVDPAVDGAFRALTYASKPVLSAHQVMAALMSDDTRTSKEHPFGKGGTYSQALLIPPREKDLRLALGVPEKLFERDSQLKSGAAVPVSYVAKSNREIRLGPSAYPWGSGIYSDTFDFKAGSDGLAEKNVFESPVGTSKHDGREVIFSKPDGDTGSALFDSEGNQVAFVPTDIAVDQRPDAADRERSVVNTYKCISCHDPFDGLVPARDAFGPITLGRGTVGKVYAYDKDALAKIISDADDYYFSNLSPRIAAFSRNFATVARRSNGLSARRSAELIVHWVEWYHLDLVTPEQAAREMGHTLPAARTLWRAALRYDVDEAGAIKKDAYGRYVVRENAQLVALYAGQPVRRAAWEQAYRDAMRADLYPWEYGGADYCLAMADKPWLWAWPPAPGHPPTQTPTPQTNPTRPKGPTPR